jgi:Na+/phosphate symporter
MTELERIEALERQVRVLQESLVKTLVNLGDVTLTKAQQAQMLHELQTLVTLEPV